MKIVGDAQFRLQTRLAQDHRARQSRQQLSEVNAAVEAVRRLGQVAPRILGLSHGVVPWGLPLVVASADGTFDVAEHDVDPARALDLGGGASTRGFQHGMRMVQFDHTPETAQAIAEDFGIGRQAPLTPIGERGVVEAAHRLDHGEGRVFQRRVGSHGHHEGLLVLRSAPRPAAVALAAEIGVVDLHEARKLARFFALGHGLHDLVLELPGGVVAHAKVPLQFQRGHVGLAAGQQVHGQVPNRQRLLAALEHGPAGQRRLVPAVAALVVHPARTTKPRPRPPVAFRAAKSLSSARSVQRSVALRFGAIPLDELHHRQPRRNCTWFMAMSALRPVT